MIDKICKSTKPQSVYLFGSAAEGNFTDQSDFDILILIKERSGIAAARKNLKPLYPLSKKFPIDLIWMSVDDFESKKNLGGIAMTVNDSGKLMFNVGS